MESKLPNQLKPHLFATLCVDESRVGLLTVTLPKNIILLFQPPYCPEVNPIERVWQEFKRWLQWQHFDSIAELQQAISRWVSRLTPRRDHSLHGIG
ncbi:MAG: hypothetical protein BRC40_06345 [Cyanobacteria bacterium QH_8_48_120]|nr:MAG: hypothetical protein BRC35_03470 [Cyanobacteria bacterium QH_10_48_56]PSO59931.1 MAG: hypothetical protein BRC36_14815 [Cyanobacteria bacterium QH_2_48_84]PSO74809.1 MAG: hypothetical protein BRC40_06345 [Cyanobacteria bacterium QH_8_48_120]PSO81977.1 MAG: hypothetical protein BRC44_03570 [Cyanobacteria bacterium QS_4_48_99]PSO85411.1 MAG: hypothetical protein BRC43_14200 [Cyanobacteria bacterium QS_3_48_167]PSO89053.1 MAG: hypothetical protein BRC46_16780 [Cyanobacteria bacterium QS_6